MPFFRSVLKQDTGGGGGGDSYLDYVIMLEQNGEEPVVLLPSYPGALSYKSSVSGSGISNALYNENLSTDAIITIGNKVIDVWGLLYNQRTFNGNVIFGNELQCTTQMFCQCHQYNYNKTHVLPDSISEMYGMFMNCFNFNQPVVMPNCPDSTFSAMFLNCTSFNQPLVINSSAIYTCYQMLYGCTNFGSSVTITGTTRPSLTTPFSRLFMNCNNSKRKEIHFNSALNSYVNITSTSSLVGAAITWTTMTNGFYNATYNVYCYYNYSG